MSTEQSNIRDVPMPEVGEDVGDVMVAAWMKQAGDQIARGDVIAELQTEKVNMEIESPYTGTIAEILVQEGESVPVGTPIARIAATEA